MGSVSHIWAAGVATKKKMKRVYVVSIAGACLVCAGIVMAMIMMGAPTLLLAEDEEEAALLGRRAYGGLSPAEFAARHRLSEGRIIALRPGDATVQQLASEAERWLGIAPTRPWRAINGTEALEGANLPLYARLILSTGRHDHMQVGNAAMLGCLLSHTALWRWWARRANGTADALLVLEEDAYLDMETSAPRLATLLEHDLKEASSWDILMLEPGHITIGGPMRRVGELAMTWDLPSSSPCTWMGTRGYLLRASGAQKLLRHVDPTMQVDALLGLVSTFDPDFRMFWTRLSVAHQRMLTLSTVQDRCLKCYMPQSARGYFLGLMLVAAASSLVTARVISAAQARLGP